jgi:SprT protein
MLVNPELKIKVESKVKETIELIESKYHFKLSRPIQINFDITGSYLAGQANLTDSILRFNPAYLNKYGEDYIEDTIPHEVVHICVWEYYGGRVKGHGKEWKSMMLSIGQSPYQMS